MVRKALTKGVGSESSSPVDIEEAWVKDHMESVASICRDKSVQSNSMIPGWLAASLQLTCVDRNLHYQTSQHEPQKHIVIEPVLDLLMRDSFLTLLVPSRWKTMVRLSA